MAFTSPLDGLAAEDPLDPATGLTNDQASRAIQFFIRPQNGYFEARFGAIALGTGGTCASG
eukprot:6721115-Prymnesium_polylepis.1